MTDDESKIIRLREALNWYWRLTGQLQEELRAERAISDFWQHEAGRKGCDACARADDDLVWHRWHGSEQWNRRPSQEEQIPQIVSWHARRQP